MTFPRSVGASTLFLSTLTITSPISEGSPCPLRVTPLIPALAQGELGGTSRTTAPLSTMGIPLLAASCGVGRRSRYEMPSTARCTCPYLTSCSTTPLAVSMGMAKPTPALTPAPRDAVLIPIRLPPLSSSGPPELPGLMAASVCTTPLILRPVGAVICLFLPEMTPVVRVWSWPKGLPMATAIWPTFTGVEDPTFRGMRSFLGASILSTARSLSGSTPVSLAS
mmetsp:Transcript_2631/g.5873  ORF Transcript_2631/g.5873 Transcript_2631/m.5873 type:complete len:223 (+) Transcript_2631:347-1015(+)